MVPRSVRQSMGLPHTVFMRAHSEWCQFTVSLQNQSSPQTLPRFITSFCVQSQLLFAHLESCLLGYSLLCRHTLSPMEHQGLLPICTGTEVGTQQVVCQGCPQRNV
uniref:Uncharacterized protein n=1 Tax=Knipowitschia caucasica TaxID=637954 RepID=A0AAV2LT08_KNICA